MAAPMAKPIATRWTETSVAVPRVPSWTSSIAVSEDLAGGGELALVEDVRGRGDLPQGDEDDRRDPPEQEREPGRPARAVDQAVDRAGGVRPAGR